MDSPNVFKIVIAYENCCSGSWAIRMTERLAIHLPPSIRISTESWKFELIENPRLQELAVESIAEADMLILAASGNKELPPVIAQWIERWALRPRTEPVALVALHDGEVSTPDKSNALRAYLHGMARQGNVDFFWYGEDRSTEGVEHISLEGERPFEGIYEGQLVEGR